MLCSSMAKWFRTTLCSLFIARFAPYHLCVRVRVCLCVRDNFFMMHLFYGGHYTMIF